MWMSPSQGSAKRDDEEDDCEVNAFVRGNLPTGSSPPPALENIIFSNWLPTEDKALIVSSSLHELVYVCEDGSIDFCHEGGMDFVLRSLKAHMRNRSVVRCSCLALLLLISDSPSLLSNRKVVSKGGVELMLEAMQVHTHDVVIRSFCISALKFTFMTNQDIPFHSERNALESIMKNDSLTQSIHALPVLCELAKKEENQALMVESGAVQVVLRAYSQDFWKQNMLSTARATLTSLGTFVVHSSNLKSTETNLGWWCRLSIRVVYVGLGVVSVFLILVFDWYPEVVLPCFLVMWCVGVMVWIVVRCRLSNQMRTHFQLAVPSSGRPIVGVSRPWRFGYRTEVPEVHDDFTDAYLDFEKRTCWTTTHNHRGKSTHRANNLAREKSETGGNVPCKNSTAKFGAKKEKPNCVVLVRPGKADVVLHPKFPERFIEFIWHGLDKWKKATENERGTGCPDESSRQASQREPLLLTCRPLSALKEVLFWNDPSEDVEQIRERLQELVHVCKDGTIEFCQEGGGVEVVLQCMRAHIQNKAIVRRCCIAVEVVCCSKENREAIVSQGVMDVLIEAMQKHMSDVQIHTQCMCVINILLRNDYAPMMLGRDAIRTIVRGMEQHSQNRTFQNEAINALLELTKTKENRESVIAEGGFDAVEAAIRGRFLLDWLFKWMAHAWALQVLGSFHVNGKKKQDRTCFSIVIFFLVTIVIIVLTYCLWDLGVIVRLLPLLLSLGFCWFRSLLLLLEPPMHYELVIPPANGTGSRPAVFIVSFSGLRRFQKKYDDFTGAHLDRREWWTVRTNKHEFKSNKGGCHDRCTAAVEDGKKANCVVLERPGKRDIVLYPRYPGMFIQVIWRGLDKWKNNSEGHVEGTEASVYTVDSQEREGHVPPTAHESVRCLC